MKRRSLLGASAGLLLAGCADTGAPEGGFEPDGAALGHRLRQAQPSAPVSRTHRTQVLIAGGGVAALAAARACQQAGVQDFVLLELHESAGGNARAGRMGGLDYPLGAHYLPLPGDDAPEVQDLLEELGLRQRVAGRWVVDERHLCHSPQERLYFQGAWHEGLLPVQGVGAATLEQYRRFSSLVRAARLRSHWAVPAQRSRLAPEDYATTTLPFAHWLARHGLDDAHLLWYLDYCCRDDYGAGLHWVSAWAGLHYFASRHGFHAPGEDEGAREGVLTWPQGNAWLTERLAQPLGERLRCQHLVLRIAEQRHGVEVDAWDARSQSLQRWVAQRVVVALPVHVAARVVESAPGWLSLAARQLVHAPWVVSNWWLDSPLHDAGGAAPSWDNVLYGSTGLGYVNATHQSLRPVPGATVLTHYRTLLPSAPQPGSAASARGQLLQQPWQHWRDAALAELAPAHPDLARRTQRVQCVRHGHAMAVPTPGFASQIGLSRTSGKGLLLQKTKRLVFAHSDWAGHSVFEEAFVRGHAAAHALGLPRQ